MNEYTAKLLSWLFEQRVLKARPEVLRKEPLQTFGVQLNLLVNQKVM